MTPAAVPSRAQETHKGSYLQAKFNSVWVSHYRVPFEVERSVPHLPSSSHTPSSPRTLPPLTLSPPHSLLPSLSLLSPPHSLLPSHTPSSPHTLPPLTFPPLTLSPPHSLLPSLSLLSPPHSLLPHTSILPPPLTHSQVTHKDTPMLVPWTTKATFQEVILMMSLYSHSPPGLSSRCPWICSLTQLCRHVLTTPGMMKSHPANDKFKT